MSLSIARRKAVDRLKSGNLSNEAQVKQAVILPILRNLDWDDEDPSQFRPEHEVRGPEFAVRNGYVDYALFTPAGPRVFIEAKRTGALDAKGEAQLFKYAANQGIPLLILTDGDRWDFYLSMAGGMVSERCFLQIRLSESSDQDEKHLDRVLRREHVITGSARQFAETLLQNQQKRDLGRRSIPKAWQALVTEPDGILHVAVQEKVEEICNVKPDASDVNAFLSALQRAPESIKRPINPKKPKVKVRRSSPQIAGPGEWISLANYGSPTNKRCPTAVRLWDGTERPLRNWYEIIVEVVSRLYANGILTNEHVPLGSPRARRTYLVNSVPRNPDGSRFKQFKQLNAVQLYVRTHLSAEGILRYSKWLLEHFGKDPRTDAFLKESES